MKKVQAMAGLVPVAAGLVVAVPAAAYLSPPFGWIARNHLSKRTC